MPLVRCLARRNQRHQLGRLRRSTAALRCGHQRCTCIAPAIARTREGKEISTPAELITALQNDMASRLVGTNRELNFDASIDGPNIWLMVGVNGAGKTTSLGKISAQQVALGSHGDDGSRRHLPRSSRRANCKRGPNAVAPKSFVAQKAATHRRSSLMQCKQPMHASATCACRHCWSLAEQHQPHGRVAQSATCCRKRRRHRY